MQLYFQAQKPLFLSDRFSRKTFRALYQYRSLSETMVLPFFSHIVEEDVAFSYMHFLKKQITSTCK